MMDGGVTIEYVIIPDGSFDLIVEPGYSRVFNRGLIGLVLLAMANDENSACSVVNTTSMTNLSSHTMMAMFSTTPADSRRAVKTS